MEIHVDGKVAGWCADVAGDDQPVISPTPVPDIVGIFTSLYIGAFSPKCPQYPGRPGNLFLPAWPYPYQNVVIFAQYPPINHPIIWIMSLVLLDFLALFLGALATIAQGVI